LIGTQNIRKQEGTKEGCGNIDGNRMLLLSGHGDIGRIRLVGAVTGFGGTQIDIGITQFGIVIAR
jgi:hypothetical protein